MRYFSNSMQGLHEIYFVSFGETTTVSLEIFDTFKHYKS